MLNSITAYCESKGLQLILECNTNAHDVIRDSTDTNPRSEFLLYFISGKKLIVINRGVKATFVTKTQKAVLDITLSMPQLREHNNVTLAYVLEHGTLKKRLGKERSSKS